MANIVQIKRSAVAGKVPLAGDLEIGELAINFADGLIYSKNTTGNVVVVASINTSNISEVDNLYFTNARAIGAFTEGTGINIDANGLISSTVTGGGSSVTVSNTAPVSPSEGDLYWDEELGRLYIYYTDGDSSQWVDASPQGGGSTSITSADVVGVLTAGNNIDIDANGLITASTNFTSVSQNIIPSANDTFSLGSPEFQWKDLYLSGNSLYIGNVIIKSTDNTIQFVTSDGTTSAAIANTPTTDSAVALAIALGG